MLSYEILLFFKTIFGHTMEITWGPFLHGFLLGLICKSMQQRNPAFFISGIYSDSKLFNGQIFFWIPDIKMAGYMENLWNFRINSVVF
jgi:hypothetical protein